MHLSFKISAYTCLIFCLFACNTILDVDLPKDEVKAVLNSSLSSDTGISITLSESTDILDPEEEYPKISNAEISLYEDGQELGNIENRSDGLFYFDHLPKPGSEYLIEVDVPEFPSLRSEFQMPVLEDLNGIDTTREVVQDFFGTGREELPALELHISDRAGEHFYTTKAEIEVALLVYLDVFFIDTVYVKTPISLNSSDPILGEGAEAFGSGDLVFSDELFSESEYKLTVYYFDVYTEENPEEFVDLDDEDLIQAIQNLGFTPDDVRVEYGPKWVYLSFGSMSKELFEYQVSRTLQNNSTGNPFSQPVQVSNNIENGFGVFGGVSYTKYKLSLR